MRFSAEGIASDPTWHQRASERLAHRGPDDAGHYLDEYCEMVHRRLSIIDLTPTGHQPMANEDGSVQVVFNGEIYNHVALREHLQGLGHRFRGTSDTEVLVHLYEEYDLEMTARLRGMFALAIYDRRGPCVVLIRDRFGIKPLYLAEHQGQWIAASEIKAILSVDGFQPSLDRQACYDFLGLGYVPEPLTAIEQVRAVPHGTAIRISREGMESYRYHELCPAPDKSMSFDHAVDRFAESLERAVGAQALADVPVAALLSGGIDSSLVVAAHARSQRTPLATFNARFPDRQFDETPIASAVANHCATEHETIDIEESPLDLEGVLGLVTHFDQPFADSSLVPTYLVCKAIRDRGVVCALGGDGGDESYGGYARFWRANVLARMMRWPRWSLKATGAVAGCVSGVTRDFGRQLAKAAELAQAGYSDAAAVLAGLSNYLSEAQKEELVLSTARQHLLPVHRHFRTRGPQALTGLEDLSRRMTENLFAVGLPSDMLRKVDMMSMLTSIEVRVPLLDEDLVEIGLSLPHNFKSDGRRGKLVMRELAGRWLPREVANHSKHGFSIPMDRVFGAGLGRLVTRYIVDNGSRVATFVKLDVVRNWVSMYQRSVVGRPGGSISRGGLQYRLFALLALEVWMRSHDLHW